MAKIKVIWKDGSVSYAAGNGNCTESIDQAKEYKTILIAARSARIILRDYELAQDVRVIEKGKEYIVF